jgi:hypothetical protein
MNQIEQLRANFSKMGIDQKKQFIDNLRQKLHGSKNQEYIRFLNECIQKYNAEAQNIPQSSAYGTNYSVQNSSRKGKSKKGILITLSAILLIIIGAGLFMVMNTNLGFGRSPLVGEWQSQRASDVTIVFYANNTGTMLGRGFFYTFEWSTDDGILTAELNDGRWTWSEITHYTLQGPVLTITAIAGNNDELSWPSPWIRAD